MIRNALIILCVMIAVSGCATGRIEDLKDCGKFSVGGGPGLEMTGKLGCVLHPSIGVFSITRRFGHENRDISGVWDELAIVWPIAAIFEDIRQTFSNKERPPSIFASYFCESFLNKTNSQEHVAWWIPLYEKEVNHNPYSYHELTDLEFGATVLLPSVRIGINPLEIVDFTLGFVGTDIAGDDPKNQTENNP